ncbi:hypothetical protein ACIQWR_23385 [Streptomyces sp. NPDC098789]|uniref:hypothetical protein n=1 Tax=Streptomyces sp. NPDC098789 TaxID=3366098 RepID=UPI003827DE64
MPSASQPRRPRKRRPRPAPVPPLPPVVIPSWRRTWREGRHRIALSLAGSTGAAAVVVLDWWLRGH